jgi:formylglycine-generating enzyme required for sulfatase activity
MGNNPSEFKGAKNPVERVSWNDAQEFIKRLNKMTGMQFRLPTEAEWEYAARGGNKSQGYNYSGGNIFDVAWAETNSTHMVGTKRPNELGIYDMSGNVSEWCSDWFGKYKSSTQTNPVGPSSGTKRVMRGGDYQEWASFYCTVSYRYSEDPNKSSRGSGFRLVLSAE